MASGPAPLNDLCRFCLKSLRVHGVICNSTQIFEGSKKQKSPCDRLAELGLALNRHASRSERMCKTCLAVITRSERDHQLFKEWQDAEFNATGSSATASTETLEKRPRQTPSKTPRDRKKLRRSSPQASSSRRSITQVTTTFQSKAVNTVADQGEAGIINHIVKQNWKTAANLIAKHKELFDEIMPKILDVIDQQCTDLCSPNSGFLLWKTTPDDLKNFSFHKLLLDFGRQSPFLLKIFETICKNNIPAICAALSISMRGREPRLSAFSYYLNCILQYGGAKKAVFQRLSKMSMTTTYKHAVGKQKHIAKLCGESLQTLKVSNELFLRSTAASQAVPAEAISQRMEDLTLTDEDIEDGYITDLPMILLPDSKDADAHNFSESTTSWQSAPPASYSIIIDNIDFYIKAHSQSSLRTNKSIHWVHHIAVEDRIPIQHLSNERPVVDITNYDISHSLPGQETQSHFRREFIVLGSRILTEYLDAFKPLAKAVVHHIPHKYSDETSQHSTDYPLGLLFKNENVTADLIDVLKHLQNEYVPRGTNGLSSVIVGGDRLTEANSRNIQTVYADGTTKESRLEGLVFMFEDWHAIRNLLQIHHKIFCKKESSKDHGTLFANMNVLRCTNAKQGPTAAYSAYKEFLKKDTTALFLAAAMETFALEHLKDIPSNFIPDVVLRGTEQDKRVWLHAKTAEVVDRFVMLDYLMDTTKDEQKERFPCGSEDCGKIFNSYKARQIHELKKHKTVSSGESCDTPTSTPSNRDHKKEHSEARLGFGFMMLDMLDAVKEGDGERLLRLYKLALLFYKAYGHSQYAYSTFLMSLQVNYTLSPRMAHTVTWNRFWNGRGGHNNIPLDLHLEHLNNFLKSFLKGLGPNLNENSADRVSRSISVLKEILDTTDDELQVKPPGGQHRSLSNTSNIETLVNIFKEAEVFKYHPHREFKSFPSFQKNLLGKLKFADLNKWMKDKLKALRKVPI